MEFKSLKNIETSFRQIRLFGIVFVVMCTLITGMPFGTPIRLPKRNGRRFTSWMAANR